MKKLFVGMFALMMLMGLATSCNSKSDANNAGAETTEAATEEVRPLADLLKDAKENGANWSVDEWKAAYREMAINVKPAMIEWKTVTDEFDKDTSNPEIAKKMESLLTNTDLHAMEEFITLAESTENGKIVSEDDDFEKAMKEELGLPDLD